MTSWNSDIHLSGVASYPLSAEGPESAWTLPESRIIAPSSLSSFHPLHLGSNTPNLDSVVGPWAPASHIDDSQDEDAGGVPLNCSDRSLNLDAVACSDHDVAPLEPESHPLEPSVTLSSTAGGGVQLPSSFSRPGEIHEPDRFVPTVSDYNYQIQVQQSPTRPRQDIRMSQPITNQLGGPPPQVDRGVRDEFTITSGGMVDTPSTFAEFNQPVAFEISSDDSISPEAPRTGSDPFPYPIDVVPDDANAQGFLPPGAREAMLAYHQRGTGMDPYPVDDVRLDFDVADFLDRWHMQIEMPEAGLIEIDADRIRDWRPPPEEYVIGLPHPSRDIQGLDWTCLGTRRDLARIARNMLYPAYDYHRNPRSPKSLVLTEPRNLFDFKQIHSKHRARFTHFQLRHVLAATSRNDVFYAAYNKVIRTSLACPDLADPIIDLSSPTGNLNRATADCHITTIAVSPQSEFTGYASHSMLVAGGFEGEYAMLNLNSDSTEAPTEGFVSHAVDGITTHIHTLPSRRTGALGAAFCSNDRRLRILDMTTNSWINSFEYADQLNCAATSPDGRLRVVVGDTNHSLITDAERGDVLFSMHDHADHAFACAWADDGYHVATGAQDGKVVVYDARYWGRPLVRLDREMGCVRSLQFTETGHGAQALVVAESDDIVSVYDSTSWCSKQTIDFFGSVAGVTTLDGGRELVVANGDKLVGGLMVFERSDSGLGGPYYDREGPREESSAAGKARRVGRKRATDHDEADNYWENQPKRFGIGLESLII